LAVVKRRPKVDRNVRHKVKINHKLPQPAAVYTVQEQSASSSTSGSGSGSGSKENDYETQHQLPFSTTVLCVRPKPVLENDRCLC
jgi:hypothetical protein